MKRSTRWLAQLTASAAAAAVLAGAAPVAGAAPAAAADPAVPTTGFTDKSGLTADGRAVVASGVLPVADGSAPAGSGVTYHVDSAGGSDSADGRSPATAWRSLAKVNATTFAPGDRILLKAGSSWSAEGDAVAKEAYDYTRWVGGAPVDVVGADATALLAPKGSGTAASPIVLSSYGDGAAPELNGRGVVNDVLQLSGQQHWDVSNLEITNVTDGFDATTFQPGANQGQLPGEENPKTGDLRGIHVQAENAGTLRGVAIHDVFVHDVSGVMWSIGNSGLDRSKRTGGILFEGLKGDGQTASQFQDISVRDSVVANTAFANVAFKQFSGMGENRYRDVEPGWGDRAVAKASTTGVITEDPDWRPHTNVDVSGNYLTNRDTEYGWNSLYLTSVQRATVAGNSIDGTGVSGIEMYYSDDVVVEDNEVAEVEMRVNAADSNAIDPDRGTSNILIQHNYVHESGEGILLCGFSFSTAVVRYNVIQDVDKNYINPHGDSGVNVVHNNLMYNTQKPVQNNGVGFFQSSGSAASYLLDKNRHHVLNNVFVNTRADVTSARFQSAYPGVFFSNNSYHGPKVVPPAEDPNPVTGDPKLVGEPAAAITNAMIAAADSPLVAAGAPVDLAQLAPGFAVTGNSTQSRLPVTGDFFGRALTAPPTVGPTSYVPPAGKGLVTGVVRDSEGAPVPGATVSYGTGSVVADGNGRYAVEAAVGGYALVPSADGYADGPSVAVTLADRATRSADLPLGPTTATTGDLVGTVTSSTSPVAGATVTASREGSVVATATTGANGSFAFTDLPAGEGYAVSVAKDGYQSASTPGVTVRAARTVTLALTLAAVVGETVYAIDETFDDEGTGTFTGTGDGALLARPNSAVGTITIEEDPARAGNKFLRISKTSSSAGTLAVHNALEQNLTGTVTIEARLQRTSTTGTPNQIAMYSYT
ncbi:carboxypeptidase regulatory-like domain-containing protein, partial [Kineococcus glutinatus]|uniref:carboxypeptidase regulatory-like domain-containing protein n=1 Tax=Kineococcus glutinatus TaxID=1070872 RepID=UPI0031EA62B8